MSIRVMSYNEGTSTAMCLEDVLSLVEDKLGSDVSEAIKGYISEQYMSAREISKQNAINYIEDGIWYDQIQESNVVSKISKSIINNLDKQGYIKKTKSISNFEVNEDELIEIIDNSLSEGILNYFN